MSDERLLGELIASHKHLHEDVSEIKRDVKRLNEFQWRWTGKMTVYSAVVALVATVVTEYIFWKH